jgi:hypothetical protein
MIGQLDHLEPWDKRCYSGGRKLGNTCDELGPGSQRWLEPSVTMPSLLAHRNVFCAVDIPGLQRAQVGACTISGRRG